MTGAGLVAHTGVMTKFQCTECEHVHDTFSAASKCHWGIGGVVEVDEDGNEVEA